MSYRALGYPLRCKPPLDRLRPLIRPGFVSRLLPWARAHPSAARATRQRPGGIWEIVPAADTPRFGSVGAMIYTQGTNLNPNPEGVDGSGAMLPNGWTASLLAAVPVVDVAPATLGGIKGVNIRIAGTPNVAGGRSLTLGPAEAIAAGVVVANQVFVAMVAGSTANISNFGLRCHTEAGLTNFTPGSLASIPNIRVTTGTLSSTQIRFQHDDTVTPVDITLFVGWPDRKHSSIISPPVLPADATTAASTVGADLPAALLANFGVPPNGVGTYILRCLLPQPAPAGVTQMVLQIDDGSNANRFFLRNAAGGATLQLGRTLGGVDQVVSLGSMTAGVPFNLGIGIAGDGSAYGSLNGGAVGTVTGGPSSGLLNFRAGNSVSAGASINGEMLASFLRAALSPTALQAAIAAYT